MSSLSLLWLPPALVLLVLFFALRKKSGVWAWILLFAFAGSCLTTLGLTFLILRQKSSTAGIGLLFVPFYAALAAPFAGLGGYCLHRIWHWRESVEGGAVQRLLLAIAVSVTASVVVLGSRIGARISQFERAKDEATEPARVEAILQGALEQRDYFVLSAVARNPRTPPGLLLALAQSADAELHEKRHELIDLYDRDQLAVVRHALRNPNLPAEAIPLLAQSRNSYVLADVSWNKRTSAALLREVFQRDDSYLVRWSLAANRNTPQDLLERLARESEEPGSSGVDTHRATRSRLAANEAAPAHVLAALASDPHAEVRRAVARNAAAPPETLARLASDPEEEVRFYLSTNENLPREVAETLLNDPADPVRRYASRRLGALEAGPPAPGPPPTNK